MQGRLIDLSFFSLNWLSQYSYHEVGNQAYTDSRNGKEWRNGKGIFLGFKRPDFLGKIVWTKYERFYVTDQVNYLDTITNVLDKLETQMGNLDLA